MIPISFSLQRAKNPLDDSLRDFYLLLLEMGSGDGVETGEVETGDGSVS